MSVFFIVSKFLKFLTHPLSWIFVLFLAALLVSKPRYRKILSWSGMVLLLLLSNKFIADSVAGLWEMPVIPLKQTHHYQVAVILGGAAGNRPIDPERVFLNPSADRVILPVTLYRMGKIDKILYCGGAGSVLGPQVSEALLVQKLYASFLLPDSICTYEPLSKNTHENAVEAAKYLSKMKIQDTILLITSPLHMKRSLDCFKKQGILVQAYPISTVNYGCPKTLDYLLFPDIEALNIWHELIHEWIGWVSYKLMGYC